MFLLRQLHTWAGRRRPWIASVPGEALPPGFAVAVCQWLQLSSVVGNAMTRTTPIALVAAATVAAAVAAWFWAVQPLGFASYLSATGASDADVIRQYWPHCLVQPQWVSDVPSRLINWQRTEAAARLAVVLGLWLVISGGAVLRSAWRRKCEPDRAAAGMGHCFP